MDGIIAVPATPFTDDDRVDIESLRRYVSRSIAQGVVGFVAPAVAGEVDCLSVEERTLVVRTIIDEAAGRVPVIGGASAPDPSIRLAVARNYLELGCAGLLVHIPYENEDAYIKAVRELSGVQPEILMLQDLDAGPVPVSLLARLHREVPPFDWLKLETSDKLRKCSKLLEETEGRLQIGSAGPDVVELLDRGVRAYLPTLYHDIYARIWSLYRAEDRRGAVDLWRRLVPCLSFAAAHGDKHWHISKQVLQAEGIFATARTRVLAPPPDPVEARMIAEIAEYAQELSRTIAEAR